MGLLDPRFLAGLPTVTALPSSPATGYVCWLSTADSTAKAPPGVYLYDGTGWLCLQCNAVYDLGSTGATPSHTLIAGARYKATQSAAVTTWTVSISRPGIVYLTLAGAYSLQSPTMTSRTAKALGDAAWDDAAVALKKVALEDDGTYLIYICSEMS